MSPTRRIRVVTKAHQRHSTTTVLANLLQNAAPIYFRWDLAGAGSDGGGERDVLYSEHLLLKQGLVHVIQHRLNIIERRSRHERQKREERLHVVAGLLFARAAIDDVVGTIKKSSDRGAARSNLEKRLR